MMMMLRDDLVLELFDDPRTPPAWIEGIDVETGMEKNGRIENRAALGAIIMMPSTDGFR